MIRVAIAADKMRVIQLLKDSRIGAGFDKPSGFTFPFDAAYAERFFLQHLNNPNATSIVNDVDGVAQGILSAISYEHPYGPVRVAQETMWWIDPAHRGGTAALRMIDSYGDWARSQGCRFTGLAGMGEDPAVRILYERRGYAAEELHFLKAI